MSKNVRGASRTSQIIAATIGNALEWYDFLIFGFLTAIVSKLFFPADNEYCALLATTATFGVGFLMRPVGGILIGMYGDRCGRKAAMQLIIMLTTVAMAIMTFAPTYAAFGIGAPLLIVFARLLQGFATGGEFAPSTAFLVESAPHHRRGFYGSWQMFGQALAMVFGTAMGALITSGLSAADLNAWGWRVPFLVGMLICPVGLWIRKHLEEPEAYRNAHTKHENVSLRKLWKEHKKALLVSTAITTSGTMSTYILHVYMPTFAHKTLGIPLNQSFTAQCVYGMVAMCLIPVFGILSDKFGRKRIIIASLSVYGLLLYPMLSWLNSSPSFLTLALVLICVGGSRCGYGGVMSTVLAEQFPTKVRSTGMSVAYNIAVMCFGGSASFVVTWLIQATGTPLSMAMYLIVAAVIGLVASLFIEEPSIGSMPLPEESEENSRATELSRV